MGWRLETRALSRRMPLGGRHDQNRCYSTDGWDSAV